MTLNYLAIGVLVTVGFFLAYESGFRRGWNKAIVLGIVVGKKSKPRWKQ